MRLPFLSDPRVILRVEERTEQMTKIKAKAQQKMTDSFAADFIVTGVTLCLFFQFIKIVFGM